MSGQIFISYRREESRWLARSLHDRLAQRFDRDQIFMDVDSVGLGEDFVKTIEETVAQVSQFLTENEIAKDLLF
jgi:phage tail sheath gpL-like